MTTLDTSRGALQYPVGCAEALVTPREVGHVYLPADAGHHDPRWRAFGSLYEAVFSPGDEVTAAAPTPLPGKAPAARARYLPEGRTRGGAMALQWIDAPQGRLRVDDGGAGGLPIVLVHGLAASLTVWKHQLPHLRRYRRTVAYDLRGMGESAPPRNGDYSLAGMAEDLDAVAGALGLDRFVLAGHSYAGAVVGTYAAAHPDRVAALVLVDTGGSPKDFPAEMVQEYRRQLAADYVRFTDTWWDGVLANARDDVRRLVKGALRATPREAFTAALEGSLAYDAREALARYPGRRCAVVAEAFDLPNAVHRVVPGVAYRVMKGVSHWLMLDRPDEFNGHLDALLTGATAGEAAAVARR